MAYVYPNYKSKAALKRAVAAGEVVMVKDNTPWGQKYVVDEIAYVEGPHYPEPHRWYAKVTVKDGKVVKVT